jgi:hypothetical protein
MQVAERSSEKTVPEMAADRSGDKAVDRPACAADITRGQADTDAHERVAAEAVDRSTHVADITSAQDKRETQDADAHARVAAEAVDRPTHVADITSVPSHLDHHDFLLYSEHRRGGINAFNKYLKQQGTPGSRMLTVYQGEAGYGVMVDKGLGHKHSFIGIREGATLCQMRCTAAVAKDSRFVDRKLSNYSFMANGRVYQPNQDKPSLGFLINDGHNEAGYNCRVVSTNDPHVLNVVATCAMLPGTILSLPYGDEYWIK